MSGGGLDLAYEYTKRIGQVNRLEEKFKSYYCTQSLIPISETRDFQDIRVVPGDSVVFVNGGGLRGGLVYQIYKFYVYDGYSSRAFLIWDILKKKFTLKLPYEVSKLTL